jgi:protein-S-isoprenylcysteine O-methyltransferase Ste14
MNDYKIWIFFIGTILIILLSWFVSIKHGRYHGIPRFFAFESILSLLILNAKPWFVNPFSLLQVLSWVLLIASIIYAAWSLSLFLRLGEPRDKFEDTTKIVTTGIYRYIRHPMYASLMFLGTGAFLKSVTPATIVLAVINIIALYLTCRIEEKEMFKRFGDEYNRFMRQTKMFIPFLI